MNGNTKLIEAGEKYCKSKDSCQNCPLSKGICLDCVGQLCGVDKESTLYDLYNMLYEISVYVGDTDFMK